METRFYDRQDSGCYYMHFGAWDAEIFWCPISEAVPCWIVYEYRDDKLFAETRVF